MLSVVVWGWPLQGGLLITFLGAPLGQRPLGLHQLNASFNCSCAAALSPPLRAPPAFSPFLPTGCSGLCSSILSLHLMIKHILSSICIITFDFAQPPQLPVTNCSPCGPEEKKVIH